FPGNTSTTIRASCRSRPGRRSSGISTCPSHVGRSRSACRCTSWRWSAPRATPRRSTRGASAGSSGGDGRRKLEAALRSLLDVGAVTIDWLEEASLRALQRQLRQADYHVFHFIGHGGYDHDADDGVLLFEDEQN